jgi:TonB-linked SusC/RagA family outer membrane protein
MYKVLQQKLWMPPRAITKLLLIMRLTTLILITAILQVSASGFAQKISLSERNASLTTVLDRIRTQTGYDFFFESVNLKSLSNINIKADKEELREVLHRVLTPQNLVFSIKDNAVIIRQKEKSILDNLIVRFQQMDVKGRVVDEQGKPLPNASIRIKGKSVVTNTDQNGEFELKNVDEAAILQVSYVGFRTLEVPVKGVAMPLEIKLNVATGELEEVNVTYNTGYQTLSKERATGSFVVIDNKKFNEQAGTNVLSRLPSIANSISTLPAHVSGNNSLIMRGVQTFSGPIGALIVLDNFPYEGDINNINPNDIENITLLRDAAAASIWGAKAGNGVIVITTKKGRLNQKLNVEFNTNLSLKAKPDLFYLKTAGNSNLIDFEKFLFSNGYYNSNLQNNPTAFQTPVIDILEKQRKGLISETDAATQLDVLSANDIRNGITRYMYQTGINQQYALNLKGGSDNMAWVLSAGMDRNRDELDARYDRGTFRFDNLYKPLKQLTVSAGVTFTYSKSTSGMSLEKVISGYTPAYTRLVDDQGIELPIIGNSYRRAFIDTAGKGRLLDWNYYPLQDGKHSVNTASIKSVVGSFGLNYVLIPGLSMDVKYRLELQQQNNRLLNDPDSYFARDYINQFTTINNTTGEILRPVPLGSIFDISDADITSHNLRGQINWDKTWGKHNISAILGSELNSRTTDDSRNRLYGYKDDLKVAATVDYLKQFPYFQAERGSAMIDNLFSTTQFRNRFTAQYTNWAYAYDQKYILSVSGRKDAANLFGVNIRNKWNLLWSAGAAWDISKEKFYKSDWMPYLKLRATYGFGGNVLPNASSMTTLFYNGISAFTGGQIASVSSFSNPKLRWEKIATLNFGLDFRMQNDRINGSVEYYRKTGTDLYNSTLIDRTLGLGRNLLQTNNGGIKGNGLDININSANLTGKVKWNTDLNLSYYTDKVTNVYNSSLRASSFVNNGGTPTNGYPRYPQFSYRWAGLNPNTGAPQGYLNGKTSTNYRALMGDSATVHDLAYNGSSLPKYYGTVGNTVSWNNLSFTIRISYAVGYYFRRESFNYLTALDELNLHEDFVRRWQKPGDENITNVPALVYNNFNYSQFYIGSETLATKGDHIRLQYINLSYSFTRSTWHKLPFGSLKIYAVANDLGILWRANNYGIDPNYINTVRPAKSFAIGINANF